MITEKSEQRWFPPLSIYVTYLSKLIQVDVSRTSRNFTSRSNARKIRIEKIKKIDKIKIEKIKIKEINGTRVVLQKQSHKFVPTNISHIFFSISRFKNFCVIHRMCLRILRTSCMFYELIVSKKEALYSRKKVDKFKITLTSSFYWHWRMAFQNANLDKIIFYTYISYFWYFPHFLIKDLCVYIIFVSYLRL